VGDQCQPGGTRGAGVVWSVVSGEDSTNRVFVDLHAEGMRDLLGNPHVAETRIAPFHLYNGRDEFRGRTFGTGFAAMRRGRKEKAVFPIDQCLVEFDQRCRLDQHAKLRNSARGHEQRGQTEHEAIECGQIRRALPGSIADQKLMFEQKGLCGDGAYTAWAEQRREGDEEVDSEDDEFAQGANVP
jgi:hypothetical protein